MSKSLFVGISEGLTPKSFINLATNGTSHVTITGGTGVTLVGCMVISAQDLAEDAFTSGVARFRIRKTGASSVTMYRIA